MRDGIDWKVRIDLDGDNRAETDVSALVRRVELEQDGRPGRFGVGLSLKLLDLTGDVWRGGWEGRLVQAWAGYPLAGLGPVGMDVAGRAWESGEGMAWSKWNTDQAAWNYGVDGLAGTGSGEALYVAEVEGRNQRLAFRVNRLGTLGAILGGSNRFTYLRVRFSNTGTFLEGVVFGFPVTIRRGDALVQGRDYWVEIVVSGNTVVVYTTDLEEEDGGGQRVNLEGDVSAYTLGDYVGLWHMGGNTGTISEFGVWRGVFHGQVGAVRQLGDDTVLECVDYFRDVGEAVLFWGRETARNLSAQNLLNSFLTIGGWDARHRRLVGGGTVAAQGPLVLWGDTLRDAVVAVVREAGQWVFVDGRGSLVTLAGYEIPRNVIPRVDADFTVAGTYLELDRVVVRRGAVDGRVEVRYATHEQQGTGEWWALTGSIPVPAGDAVEILAESQTLYGVFDVAAPLAGQYAGNLSSTGRSTDKTAELTVTVHVDEFYGQGCVVRIANADSRTVFLTALTLRAGKRYQERDPIIVLHGEGGHGARRVLRGLFLDNYDSAVTAAEALAAEGRAGAEVKLSLPLITDNNLRLAVGLEVGNVVGIGGVGDRLETRFLVRRLRVVWETGGELLAEYWCEAREAG